MTREEKYQSLVAAIKHREQSLLQLILSLKHDRNFRTSWNDWSKSWDENVPGPWQQSWNDWNQWTQWSNKAD